MLLLLIHRRYISEMWKEFKAPPVKGRVQILDYDEILDHIPNSGVLVQTRRVWECIGRAAKKSGMSYLKFAEWTRKGFNDRRERNWISWNVSEFKFGISFLWKALRKCAVTCDASAVHFFLCESDEELVTESFCQRYCRKIVPVVIDEKNVSKNSIMSYYRNTKERGIQVSARALLYHSTLG